MFYSGSPLYASPVAPLEQLLGYSRRPSPPQSYYGNPHVRRRQPSPYVGDYLYAPRGYVYDDDEEDYDEGYVPAFLPSPRQMQHAQELARQRALREQQIREEEERRMRYLEALRQQRLEEIYRRQQILEEQQRRARKGATHPHAHVAHGKHTAHPQHPQKFYQFATEDMDTPMHSVFPPSPDLRKQSPPPTIPEEQVEPPRETRTDTPSASPSPKPTTPTPVDPDVLSASAATIQRAYRRYTLRRQLSLTLPKLGQLRTIAGDLDRLTFLHLKAALGADRAANEPERKLVLDTETGAPVPGVPENKAYLLMEDGLLKLLLKLDGVESGGIDVVREKRKQLVKSVNVVLERLDERREREWNESKRGASATSSVIVDVTPAPEVTVTNNDTTEEMHDTDTPMETGEGEQQSVEEVLETGKEGEEKMDVDEAELTGEDGPAAMKTEEPTVEQSAGPTTTLAPGDGIDTTSSTLPAAPSTQPSSSAASNAADLAAAPEDELDPADLDWVPPDVDEKHHGVAGLVDREVLGVGRGAGLGA
ncbi:hypothetical protein M427DRAFT_160459 [Gonapodya prolifera JEL478]|uniref:BAG domain-containing protein n=1 Tax=Gonapodya prolifera (strain JEL478) TaxID=1344416 RepID=A0A138ZYH6_GONPJ|nr:hypothetical protein M427DRAFT_160459 [Gonapodya prolifera JEL478]|eukprot:KXS09558.1 hypothetical protein M427DRAFT_160459 [Gonapodya prolifera JEL478]